MIDRGDIKVSRPNDADRVLEMEIGGESGRLLNELQRLLEGQWGSGDRMPEFRIEDCFPQGPPPTDEERAYFDECVKAYRARRECPYTPVEAVQIFRTTGRKQILPMPDRLE